MCDLFADIPSALENTVLIAQRCNVTLRLGQYFLPQFPTGELSTEDYLVMKAKEGLEERLVFLFPDEKVRAERRPEYDERLQVELDVINQMGFPGYFLIVMEFIQWSKDNDIPVGPGRGSGAGSLVAYALKITDLDPLEFDLLFERFLNPELFPCPISTWISVWMDGIVLSIMSQKPMVVVRYHKLLPLVPWRPKR